MLSRDFKNRLLPLKKILFIGEKKEDVIKHTGDKTEVKTRDKKNTKNTNKMLPI